jgi:hypothetical protein
MDYMVRQEAECWAIVPLGNSSAMMEVYESESSAVRKATALAAVNKGTVFVYGKLGRLKVLRSILGRMPD